MLTCKVPVKRPMPCIVILVHGVNDDGHCYSTIDKGLCKGLNARLGRDDLFAHVWHKSEHLLTPRSNGTCEPAEVIQKEGRSPVVPFYWGYRPVNRETYQAEQRNYASELRSGGAQIELPYDSYWVDHTKDGAQGYAFKDKFGNWLNDKCAKNGGLFANATTNIPDMWGPGTDTFGWGYVTKVTHLGEDKTHAIYNNAHRIYLIHAAQRLADLIASIRNDPVSKDDAINIIAHSQGTIISMLANLLLSTMQGKPRPVDAMILAHSPYGLEGTFAESLTYGLKQKDSARIQTLANVSNLIWERRSPTPVEKMLGWGSAKKDVWAQTGHGRNNFGLIYNYFCPNDQTVSMRNVQGMGWQGASDAQLGKLGPNFKQRVFAEGHPVGEAAGTVFSMPSTYTQTPDGMAIPISQPGNTSKSGLSVSFGDRKRTLNADALPNTFPFKLMAASSPFDDVDSQIQLSTAGSKILEKVFDPQSGTETDGQILADGKQMNVATAQGMLAQHGIDAVVLIAFKMLDGRIWLRRYESKQEALERIHRTGSGVTSQHSSIVENAEVAEKAMAYDLAIGCGAVFDSEGKWWDLHHRADWRDPNSKDTDARTYYQTGALPKAIKQQMNKVAKVPGLVNDYEVPPAPLDPERQAVLGTPQQWPMPDPDIGG